MEFDPTAAPVGPPIDEEEREREEEEEEERERAEGKRESEEEEKEAGAGSSSPAARKARRERERERRERRRDGGGSEEEEDEEEEGKKRPSSSSSEKDEEELEKEAERKKFAAEERLAASFVSFASGRGNAGVSGGGVAGGAGENGGNKPVAGLSVVSGPQGPWEPRRASGSTSDVSKRGGGGASNNKGRARPRSSSSPDDDDSSIAASGARAPTASAAAAPPPSPGPKQKQPPIPGLLADVFGLNASDNAAVNGKLTEPPDLALCVGGDRGQFALQAVNSAWAVFDSNNGDLLAGPFSLYSLFKVPRNSSMTDPGCVFDHSGSKRFFLTIQWYSRTAGFAYQVFVVSKSSDPREGFNGVYYVDTSGRAPGLGLKNCAQPGGGVVVAPAAAPAGGGNSSLSAAPPPPPNPNQNVSGCLGDYPSYGVDRHALWFGVNHYTSATGRLQGAALYGVRKADLLDPRGAAFPRVAVFTAWGDSNIADVASGDLRLGFTLQPATPSAGEPFDDRRGGTQYVLASSYFFRTGLPSVVAWAITNTSLIERGLPGGQAPTLSPAVVMPALPLRKPAKVFSGGLRQEAAVVAAAASAAAAGKGNGAASSAAASDEQQQQKGGNGNGGTSGNADNDFDVQRLDEKDERLQQVTLSGGSLWTNMQTAVEVEVATSNDGEKEKQGDGGDSGGGGRRRPKKRKEEEKNGSASKKGSQTVSGIAYFRVEPRWSASGAFEPVVAQNGYVAVPGHHCVNGAIAASPRSFSAGAGGGGGSGGGGGAKNGSAKNGAGGGAKNAGGGNVAAMAFSLLGPDYNYSAAFVAIRPEGPGAVVVPRPSQEPLHGFSPKAMRNGDYTGATAAPDGSLWLGAQQASGAVHVTSSGKRQNWETVLVRVDPARMP